MSNEITPKKSWDELNDRQKAFVKYYLDEGAETFTDATKSYMKAYGCTRASALTRGTVILNIVRPLIADWFDNVGLSEEFIQGKIRELAKAKEKKFFTHKGKVVDTVEVPALPIRAKAAELAAKVKGMTRRGEESTNIEGINISIKLPDDA